MSLHISAWKKEFRKPETLVLKWTRWLHYMEEIVTKTIRQITIFKTIVINARETDQRFQGKWMGSEWTESSQRD